MTRKDFQLIADLLSEVRPTMPALNWEKLVIVTAAKLATTNPRFDYAIFAKACGWEVSA